jgi:raffinose/stachyose/melibiose transport system permease protein
MLFRSPAADGATLEGNAMANKAIAVTEGRAGPAAATTVAVSGDRRRSGIDWGYALFLVPGLLAFLILIVLPVLANFGISFTRWTGVGTPVWIGLTNYSKALGDTIFWTSFRNNLYLIVAMVIIPTIIGLILAAALFDYIAKRFGNGVTTFFRSGFYLPQILPVVVAALVWTWIYNPNSGAINTMLSAIGLPGLRQNWLGDSTWALPSVMLMLIWFQIGYPLVLFMSGMQRIDPEVYEAAAIDGATWLQRFYRITVPLLRPEIYVVVLTTTINALKTFGPIYAMTRGGPGNATMVASYFSYKNFFQNANVGYGATMATVLTLIVMAIAVVYIRVQTRQEENA